MWSKTVIKAVLGITPTTYRPPYGDVDDRVRAVAKALGLTQVIWTTTQGTTFGERLFLDLRHATGLASGFVSDSRSLR